MQNYILEFRVDIIHTPDTINNITTVSRNIVSYNVADRFTKLKDTSRSFKSDRISLHSSIMLPKYECITVELLTAWMARRQSVSTATLFQPILFIQLRVARIPIAYATSGFTIPSLHFENASIRSPK